MKDELTGRAGNQIDRYALPATEMAKTSLSGYERNKLFFNNQGTAFDDLSGISGVDSIKDSRGFAIWDYDRDGFQDIVLTNINAPVLNLFRNNLGEIDNASSAGMLAVRCVGGNKTAQPSTEYSPRDAIGAKIFVKLKDKTLLRELHCGEGLAAQNSNTLIFGLGSAKQAESIVVLWPSGKQQTIENVDEDKLVTFFEDPSDAGGNDFAVEPYRKKVDTRQLTSTSGPATKMQLPGTDVQSEMVM